jgi:tetratricopeptide (TPR) repeat protein
MRFEMRDGRQGAGWVFVLAAGVLFLAGCPSTPVVEPDEVPDTPVVQRTAEQAFEEAAALWEQAENPDFEAIADLLEDAVEERPEFAEAWFNLGIAYHALGRNSDAIDAYRRAQQVNPELIDALANIGVIYLEENRRQEAEAIFNEAVALDQFHPLANLNLAQMHRERANRGGSVDRVEADEAINHVRQALAGDSQNVHAYETMSAVYYDLESYDLAQLVCENAIILNVESAALHNRLGLIALAKDDVTAAYAAFREAAALDPTLAEASMNIGAIALSYRDFEGALEAFDRALRHTSPTQAGERHTYHQAQISRAVALRGLDRYDEAQAIYTGLLEENPDDLQVLYNLGVLNQEFLQDYQTALSWFERYLRADIQAQSEHAQDVSERIDLLRQLIELIGTQPPADPAGGSPNM